MPRCFLPKSRQNEARSGHWTWKRFPRNRAVFSAPPPPHAAPARPPSSPFPSSFQQRGAWCRGPRSACES